MNAARQILADIKTVRETYRWKDPQTRRFRAPRIAIQDWGIRYLSDERRYVPQSKVAMHETVPCLCPLACVVLCAPENQGKIESFAADMIRIAARRLRKNEIWCTGFTRGFDGHEPAPYVYTSDRNDTRRYLHGYKLGARLRQRYAGRQTL